MNGLPYHKKIHGNRIYTPETLADEIGVCKKTIYRHLKNGLTALKNLRPYLILGKNAKKYFQKIYESRKHHLKKFEFFCVKCKKVVTVEPETINLESTQKMYNRNWQQKMQISLCPNCGSKLCKFVAEATTSEM